GRSGSALPRHSREPSRRTPNLQTLVRPHREVDPQRILEGLGRQTGRREEWLAAIAAMLGETIRACCCRRRSAVPSWVHRRNCSSLGDETTYPATVKRDERQLLAFGKVLM